ncbi:MAG: phosphotransferase [Clostridiales bacterium]|jgi:Ser/Thr protein kinase RdoA (MazF antagonist)|nr:phosphotransferase [Clostridiales bacterium]
MEHKYLEEALLYYNIDASAVVLLRHNENLTYRVGKDYLLQIHKPVEGFSAEYIYEGLERIPVYKAEIAFQEHLKKQGMQIRETIIENCRGERITKLCDGTLVTVSRWIEGESLDKIELNDELCYQIGDMLARLHRDAKGFRTLPIKSYDKHHCEYTKKRMQALEDKGLDTRFTKIMQRACVSIGITLEEVQNEFIMLHGDLSPSNILKTSDGLVAIDFSFFGIGHPMFDLADLFGNIGGLARRRKIAEGYRDAGGTINYKVLDACFVLTLLDRIGIHYEQWSKQDWFEPRMKRWYKETLEPYVRGERLYADDFYLLHVTG